jgi:ATP-binding cassette subfamily B protein
VEKTGISGRLGIIILSAVPTLISVSAAGAFFIHKGTLDFSVFLASLFISTGMADAMMPLMWLTNFIKKSGASAIRIQEILDTKTLAEPDNPKFPKSFDVEFENVSFRYEDRDEYALKDVSFIVPQGTVTALVGPSGAGKSTVAKLIPRFWDVECGTIRIGGADIRDISTEALMNTVSFVFQDTFLFHDSIASNILMANPHASSDDMIEAAKAAQIHDFIMSLPDGYETKAGDRGVRLSGGQKQRITIARAILRNSPVVVLDEATAFADPENEEEIIRAISNLTKNKTVIVIAHRLSTITDVNSIVVFDKGKVSETGRHDELLMKDGVYARLWKNYIKAQDWHMQQEKGEHRGNR